MCDDKVNITIDSRERELIALFENDSTQNIVMEPKIIDIGDIIIAYKNITYCIIERKTIDDMKASIYDGRYKEQKNRLLFSSNVPPHNIIYLLEGVIPEKDKNIIFSCVTSISLFSQCSIFRTCNCRESFDYIIAMSLKIKKNIDNDITIESIISSPSTSTLLHQKKQKNITYEMVQRNILHQIPMVSTVTSDIICTKYKTVSVLIDALKEDRTCLHMLTYETKGKKRKLSKIAVQNIVEYLL